MTKIMNAVRWTYNQAVEYVTDEKTLGKRSIKHVRAWCVTKEALDNKEVPWAESIPFDIRDEGARDVIKAVAAMYAKNKARRARGESKQEYKLKCRKKRDQQTMTIHSKHWVHKSGFLADLLGHRGAKLRHPRREPLPDTMQYDSRIVRTPLGEYYLCVPMEGRVWDENQVPDAATQSVASLDPGVRTFMTIYSADGGVTDWAAGDTTRIFRLCSQWDMLQSKCRHPMTTHRRRYKMRRAARRIQKRIRSLVDECHRKLAKWLCTNFRVVLIPLFETQQMVRRGHRRLNSKGAKAMCTWSHYRFRQHLKHVAGSTSWCKVVETTEEFTSKTCGECGRLHQKLGGAKNFKCPSCDYEADRDANGARNILLRYLTVNGVKSQC